jgi:hypothetical protein
MLLTFIEHLYARVVLRKSKQEAYLYSSAEQEAYRNQNDPGYLDRRPFGAVYGYIRNKQSIIVGGKEGTVRYLD